MIHKIAIFGGSGFVGRALLPLLNEQGHQITVFTRRPERHRDLNIFPQVTLEKLRGLRPVDFENMLQGHDVVINLMAILNPSKDASYRDIHVKVPQAIIRASEITGVQRILHISALKANPALGESEYLRSKGEGEAVLHASRLSVTTFRPSVIYGDNDHFLTQMSALVKRLPLLALPAPKAKIAPIYVGDVANIMVKALDNRATFGKRYDLCGPEQMTLAETAVFIRDTLKLKHWIWPCTRVGSKILARLSEWMPGQQAFSRNTLTMLMMDSTCDEPLADELKTTPIAFTVQVPYLLSKQSTRHKYHQDRRFAKR